MASKHEWDVDVNGRTYVVSLTEAEGNRWVPRVDGRAAAKALAPEESERLIRVGEAEYLLSRQSDGGFALDFQGMTAPPVAAAPTMSTGRRQTLNVPLVDDASTGWLKARHFVWTFIVVLVAAPFLWYVNSQKYEKLAPKRVAEILGYMTESPIDQAALGLWLRNTHHLADMREYGDASNLFDHWRREKDIYKPISSWRIVSVTVVPNAEVKTAIVSVVINDRPMAMNVPEGKVISWAEDPKPAPP
jgi:hypothetical protein